MPLHQKIMDKERLRILNSINLLGHKEMPRHYLKTLFTTLRKAPHPVMMSVTERATTPALQRLCEGLGLMYADQVGNRLGLMSMLRREISRQNKDEAFRASLREDEYTRVAKALPKEAL